MLLTNVPEKKTRHQEWAYNISHEDQKLVKQQVAEEVEGVPPLLRVDFEGGGQLPAPIFETRFEIFSSYRRILEPAWEWVLLNWPATEFAFYCWLAVLCLRGIKSPASIAVLPSHWMSLVILRHFLLGLLPLRFFFGCIDHAMSFLYDTSPPSLLYSQPFYGR